MILPTFMALTPARSPGRTGERARTTVPRSGAERFPGELVLRDLPRAASVTGTERVVARYLVVRVAQLAHAARGHAARGTATRERGWARAYVEALDESEERSALSAILDEVSAAPTPGLRTAFESAAACADVAGHGSGAYALRRHAYTLALEAGAWLDAMRVAAILALDARAAGNTERFRLWRSRARRLARRPGPGSTPP